MPKPLAVVNPYAPRLTFLDDRTRTRRDHEKYLNLIDAIALLHQYQRSVKSIPGCGSGGRQPDDYVETNLSDIETANQLAGNVLGRSLDELPPQTRQLLFIIEDFVICCVQNKPSLPCDAPASTLIRYIIGGFTGDKNSFKCFG